MGNYNSRRNVNRQASSSDTSHLVDEKKTGNPKTERSEKGAAGAAGGTSCPDMIAVRLRYSHKLGPVTSDSLEKLLENMSNVSLNTIHSKEIYIVSSDYGG